MCLRLISKVVLQLNSIFFLKDERDGVEYRHSTNISGHCRRDGSKRHGRYFYYETFQKEKRRKTIEEV